MFKLVWYFPWIIRKQFFDGKIDFQNPEWVVPTETGTPITEQNQRVKDA